MGCVNGGRDRELRQNQRGHGSGRARGLHACWFRPNVRSVDIRELYQEVILDHSRRPRNRGECPGANAHAEAENPSCGDEVTVHARLEPDGKLGAVSFTGQGCALSQASASLMTTKVRGLTAEEAGAAIRRLQRLMLGEELPEEELDQLGDLQVLRGAAAYPQRVKCVTLAWHALEDILEGRAKGSANGA
jgi:nitrogen fixation NifU-like protein